MRAFAAFRRARSKALLRRIWSAIRGRPQRLLAYDDVRSKIRVGGPVYRGVRSVPLAQIVGSVNRYRDFDRAFLPSQARTADRWTSLGRAYFDDVSLPPVKLYQVGEVYFVVDGNHRVSVAREMGREYIDAEVQECQVRVPVTPDMDAEDLEIVGEKADFVAHTRLDETRPDVSFDVTIAGGYHLLLEHIEVHRYLQSVEWSRTFDLVEAAAQWCDQVYLPVTRAIREAGILDDFPGRAEGDLYIWVIEHRHFLSERFGPVSLQEAARSFARQFTGRVFKRVWNFIVSRVLLLDPRFDDIRGDK
jgi:hypothetical protein